MNKLKRWIKGKPEIAIPVLYVVGVWVVSTLIAVLVIFPSNAEEDKRGCADLGMEYIGFGMCRMVG